MPSGDLQIRDPPCPYRPLAIISEVYEDMCILMRMGLFIASMRIYTRHLARQCAHSTNKVHVLIPLFGGSLYSRGGVIFGSLARPDPILRRPTSRMSI